MQQPQSIPAASRNPRDRRQFLEGSLAAGLALALPSAGAHAAEAAADLKSLAIDAHVHVWTPDTEAYPLAAGFRRDEMKPASFTPEELFRHARPAGVGRVVLIQMSFYGFDNRYMLDMLAQHPGVFSAVAVIDDSAADPASEMSRMAGLGARGFRIYPRNAPPDRWLEGPGMQAMWRAGAKQNLAMCCLVNPEALPAIDAACAQHPETPVVIDHFARIGIDGTIRDAEIAQLCRLARHPRTAVKVSAFYALGRKQPPYHDLLPMTRRLLDAFGPERLMWASDCPFQVVDQPYAASIALVRDGMQLSPGDRDWLLRRTAERVFFG
ncbi:MAG: amidohydrolase family protein [Planctomycetaceae bacterium]|nr:amidohydrolase family protein [Planctomycetaceae bacterium]